MQHLDELIRAIRLAIASENKRRVREALERERREKERQDQAKR